ncbi:hypothetical protein DPMN_156302 [Dreissena polymorpha]|uniref:Uncharacterized protein n=1 Tax=Dreissena polymorpha TaxID=45954 RepID=A0A9D4JAQ6_DREPO|nr:hypothetical protein DPMN_156302 [Dreissena polymorpha]
MPDKPLKQGPEEWTPKVSLPMGLHGTNLALQCDRLTDTQSANHKGQKDWTINVAFREFTSIIVYGQINVTEQINDQTTKFHENWTIRVFTSFQMSGDIWTHFLNRFHEDWAIKWLLDCSQALI